MFMLKLNLINLIKPKPCLFIKRSKIDTQNPKLTAFKLLQFHYFYALFFSFLFFFVHWSHTLRFNFISRIESKLLNIIPCSINFKSFLSSLPFFSSSIVLLTKNYFKTTIIIKIIKKLIKNHFKIFQIIFMKYLFEKFLNIDIKRNIIKKQTSFKSIIIKQRSIPNFKPQ